MVKHAWNGGKSGWAVFIVRRADMELDLGEVMGVADHVSSAVRCGARVRGGARAMYRVEESRLVFHVDLHMGMPAR